MKEQELRKYATCSICGEKLGQARVPMFWRVTVEQYMIDVAAVKRQMGLTELLNGNATIAAAMGPDEDMATPLHRGRITVCFGCCTEELSVAEIQESAQREE